MALTDYVVVGALDDPATCNNPRCALEELTGLKTDLNEATITAGRDPRRREGEGAA